MKFIGYAPQGDAEFGPADAPVSMHMLTPSAEQARWWSEDCKLRVVKVYAEPYAPAQAAPTPAEREA